MSLHGVAETCKITRIEAVILSQQGPVRNQATMLSTHTVLCCIQIRIYLACHGCALHVGPDLIDELD